MPSTDAILFQAEIEHGPDWTWDEPWYYGDDHSTLPRDLEPEDLGMDEVIREPRLIAPDGTIVWLMCNSPGRVYVSQRDQFDWADYNGYAPVEISWAGALELASKGEDGEGPWGLEICGPLPAECVAEMAEHKARRAADAE